MRLRGGPQSTGISGIPFSFICLTGVAKYNRQKILAPQRESVQLETATRDASDDPREADLSRIERRPGWGGMRTLERKRVRE